MLLTTLLLSIGELRSSNSTARHHPALQHKKAKRLFKRQGIVVPIVVDEHHRIIDGHLRFQIAQDLGIGALQAIVVSKATPAEVIELELALNRLAQDSNWDEARLKHKLEHLLELNIDLLEDDCPIDFTKLRYISRNQFNDSNPKPTIYQSWDTALSDRPNADYSALTTWARFDDGRLILVDAKRYRVTSDKLQALIIRNAIAYSTQYVCIEAANHAVDLISMVSASLSDHCIVRSVPVRGLSKMQRLEAQLHKINTGKVFFIRDEPNLNLVMQELRQFPNGRYDDFVDSFTQALSQMGVTSGTPTWRIS